MKKLYFLRAKTLTTVIILLTSCLSNLALAKDQTPISDNQKIRFYKVNKDMQGNRIMLTSKKSTQPGCHDFVKQVRVHRAVQTGFVACSLYRDKACRLASVVPTVREKDPRRTYLLKEGFGWLPQSEEERGVKVKSWQCDMKPELDLLVSDSQLAKEEVSRLRTKASRAKEIAQKAQQKADKAEKDATKAIESASMALKRAVDAGYEPLPEVDRLIDEEASDEDN